MPRTLLIALALLLTAAFAAGFVRLFVLRYESGEVYPPYSTLRPDPLGTKAIYAALGKMPGVEVRRNLQPLKKLHPGRPVTLVYLGLARQSFWTERELQEFDSLVFGGGRAVLAFFPYDRPPGTAETRRQRSEEREKKKKQLDGKDGKDSKDDEKDDRRDDRENARSGLVSFDEVAKRFGFQFEYLPAPKDKAFDRQAHVSEGRKERDISWHSALYFSELAPEWKQLYTCENKPVIAERSYGRGSIVLVSDSFPFSNEALRAERQTRLLARIFNGPPLLIFDEEHLGVTDQPGIVQLALKYRLHGVIATLALIAALFLWKNSVRFVPAFSEARADTERVAGRDAAQGFDNLLHRAIKPSELLGVCTEEWRRAFAHHPARAQVEEVFAREQTRPSKQRDPIAAYREIARELERRGRTFHSYPSDQ